MRSLFAPLPENLAESTDDALRTMLDERLATVELVKAQDTETLEGLDGPAVVEQLTAGVEQIETIKDALKARATEYENFDSVVGELADRATSAAAELAAEAEQPAAEGDGDETGDEDDDGAVSDEGDADEVAADSGDTADEADAGDTSIDVTVEAEIEPVAASAKPAVRLPEVPANRRPRISVKERGVPLIASGGIHGVREGSQLDMDGLVEALVKKAQSFGSVGRGDKVIVASGRFDFPAERVLGRDGRINYDLIQRVVSEKALAASGGICAPLQPLYDLPGFGSTARPVRDALTSFNATRGGVSIPTPTTIGDAAGAITIVTEAEDAQGGTYATKAILEQACPDFVDVVVAAIAARRRFGNFNARSWPENIAHEIENTRVAHARAAESFLLDGIKALSTTVTSTKSYNAVADWVYALSRGVSSIRYQLRMDDTRRFKVLAPAWLLDLMVADTIATQFDRWQAKAQIEAYLERNGISIEWYLDSPTTGTSQGFSAEVDGTEVNDFPDDAQWALFPDGAFIHLDQGELDLGLIRSPELNEVNDFEFFWETFENVGRVAPKIGTRWFTSAICPTGTFPALQTARTC